MSDEKKIQAAIDHINSQIVLDAPTPPEAKTDGFDDGPFVMSRYLNREELYKAMSERIERDQSSLTSLRAEVERLRGALEDFRDHGLRADLNPTQPVACSWEMVTDFFLNYLRSIDQTTRSRATQALGEGK